MSASIIAGPRGSRFHPSREPFRHDSSSGLQLVHSRISSPLGWFNPTRAHFRIQPRGSRGDANVGGAEAREHDMDVQLGMHFRWTSRNNRKGRHQLVTARDERREKDGGDGVPRETASLSVVVKIIARMFTTYRYWDVSWLVAYIFTWGSIVWVINAFFVWLPLERPSTEFENEILTGGGITAFIGATIFELGSVLLMLEAINENREGCFGWAVREAWEDHESKHLDFSPDEGNCAHHHMNRRNLVGKSPVSSEHDTTLKNEPLKVGRAWSWYPSWSDLKTHYVHDIGFLACSAQLFGATIFWISGFTALPGILNHLSPGLEDGIYWTPQVIGGSGFIVSGFLFMLETQKKWYIPAFNVLGWHIGFWNLIGGTGFTLCPAFGFDTDSWAVYQASLSTFWASWAFLIGSVIQLYESLQKHPVDVKRSMSGV